MGGRSASESAACFRLCWLPDRRCKRCRHRCSGQTAGKASALPHGFCWSESQIRCSCAGAIQPKAADRVDEAPAIAEARWRRTSCAFRKFGGFGQLQGPLLLKLWLHIPAGLKLFQAGLRNGSNTISSVKWHRRWTARGIGCVETA